MRIEQERCANCIGCVRFKFPKNVSALGAQEIGERVAVRTSTKQLSLASLFVFGLPVATLSLVVWFWESIWLSGAGLLLSVFAVFFVLRFERLRNYLKVYAEPI